MYLDYENTKAIIEQRHDDLARAYRLVNRPRRLNVRSSLRKGLNFRVLNYRILVNITRDAQPLTPQQAAAR